MGVCRWPILPGLAAALLSLPAFIRPASAREPEIARVLVEKAARRIVLFDGAGRAVRIYRGIQLGFRPTGPKRSEGDGRTPEGRYTIDYGNAASAYHLSLHISYPDAADRARALAGGHSPGGAIFIHGQPSFLRNGPAGGDWTAGCIAVSDKEIEELWALVPDGTPIDLVP